MKGLNEATRQMIKDLQDDLTQLLELESNIEVVWKLEKLHGDQAFLKSANYIRRQLHKSPQGLIRK